MIFWCLLGLALLSIVNQMVRNRRIDRYNRNVDRHNQMMDMLMKDKNEANSDTDHTEKTK